MNTENKAPEENAVPEQPKRSEIIAVSIIFIIIVFLAYKGISFIFTNSPLDSIPESAVVQPEQHSDTDVYIDAQAIVSKTLKSPSTAKFPSSSHATITRAGENTFKVDSYVDSQNGLGAVIRSEWSVMFEYVGDKLDTYAISIDGETVYKKQGL